MDCTQQAQKIYGVCAINARLGNYLSYREVLDYLRGTVKIFV